MAQPLPTDARSWYYDEPSFSYRPYASKAEVLSYLDTVNKRKGGFPIYITEGSKIQAYWFKNAWSSVDDLVRMDGVDKRTGVTDDNIATAAGELYETLVVIPTASQTNVTIGTSPDGTDIEFGRDMTGGVAYEYNIRKYFAAAGAFYFVNLPLFDIILVKKDI